MKIERMTFIAVVILTGMASFPSECRGQADPSWLKSWNEAQESRPLTLTSSSRIADESEPGTPLIIDGQVFNPDGTPAGGVSILAYHRDQEGFDFGPNDNSLTTWKLQGWVQTDADGGFEFHTIRPAADHLGREGAHIHFVLESNIYGRQWASKVFLADDPLVTSDQRQDSAEAGQFGWVQKIENVNGVGHIPVKIQLKEEADF